MYTRMLALGMFLRYRTDLAALAGVVVLGLVFLPAILALNLEFVGGDQFRWVPLIDDWMRGDFPLGELFRPHGGHRAAGYKLVFLLNAEIFHLNFTAEKLLAAGAIILSAYYFLREMTRVEFVPHVGSSRLVSGAVIVATYACCGLFLVNPSVLNTVANYSVISMRVFNFSGFLLVFCLVSSHLNKGFHWGRFVALLVALLVFSNFFGRAWSMVMLVTVMLAIIVSALIRSVAQRRFSLSASSSALLVYCLAMVWLYYTTVSGKPPPPESAFSLVGLVKFVAVIMSRTFTVLFRHSEFWSNSALGHHIALGLVVLATYGLATLAFFGMRLYRRSWVPIMLMAYGVGSAALVYVGRALTGSDPEEVLGMAFFPRFLFDCSVGHVGLVLVLVAACWEVFARRPVLQRAVVVSVLAALLTVGGINLRAFHQSVPSLQRYAMGMNAMFFDSGAPFSDRSYARRARCDHEALCVESREIILRYELLRAERHALENE